MRVARAGTTQNDTWQASDEPIVVAAAHALYTNRIDSHVFLHAILQHENLFKDGQITALDCILCCNFKY